ncbi:MAG: HD domain-containing protein [Acidimicrobiaceae bacterium]|nr:HD domain-containing protein [Acidimicrobiaceae bacterium]
MQTVQFTQMRDGTKAEYDLLHEMERHYIAALPDRILGALRALDDGLGGYRVSRLQHSLQAATRAERDGADSDWVVAALVHDIGDALAPENHSQLAAAVIRPYVRAEVTWAVLMHGVFQQHYYGHHLGLDPDAREAHRDNEWFAACERFCERWDQASFDPDYPTEALEHFVPMLRDVFGRAAFDPAIVGE